MSGGCIDVLQTHNPFHYFLYEFEEFNNKSEQGLIGWISLGYMCLF